MHKKIKNYNFFCYFNFFLIFCKFLFPLVKSLNGVEEEIHRANRCFNEVLYKLIENKLKEESERE